MKLTLSWLKEHVETTASLDEIVTTLTRIGLEVEGVEGLAGRQARLGEMAEVTLEDGGSLTGEFVIER